MANMNVQRTSSQTSLPSLPKVSAPTRSASSPALTSPTPKPSAFKSSPTQAADNKQDVNQVMQASCLDVRRNAQLIDTKVNNAMMSDVAQPAQSVQASAAAPAPAPTKRAPARPAPAPAQQGVPNDPLIPRNFDTALQGLKDYYKTDKTSFERNQQGHVTNASAKEMMMMRFNPHADKSAKQESEMFRGFARKEFAQENTHFIDETQKLTILKPHSKAYNAQMNRLCQHYLPNNAKNTINVSYDNRQATLQSHAAWKQAQLDHEKAPTAETQARLDRSRTALAHYMTQNSKEVMGMLVGTNSNYHGASGAQFCQDLRNNQNFNLAYSPAKQRLIDEVRTQETAKGRDPQQVRNAVKKRLEETREHGKLYADAKKSLKDFDWESKQEARTAQIKAKQYAWGAKRGSFKYEIYNFFKVNYK